MSPQVSEQITGHEGSVHDILRAIVYFHPVAPRLTIGDSDIIAGGSGFSIGPAGWRIFYEKAVSARPNLASSSNAVIAETAKESRRFITIYADDSWTTAGNSPALSATAYVRPLSLWSVRAIMARPGEIVGPRIRQTASDAATLTDSEARRFGDLAMLAEDWDGNNAEPISHEAITLATKLIEDVVRRYHIRPRLIVPLSGDGIQLEWSSPKSELEIEVYADGTLNYLLLEGHGASRVISERVDVSRDQVISAIAKFAAG